MSAPEHAVVDTSPHSVTSGSDSEGDVFSELARIQEIESLIDSMTASWRPMGLSVRERRWNRVVYERPLVVQPLRTDSSGRYVCEGPRLLVAGRDLSLGGISFEHETALPQRHVAISFPLESMPETVIVTQLTWCRFTRTGHYLAGGRFLHRLPATALVAESDEGTVNGETRDGESVPEANPRADA